jgi:tRNA threonylcarbamoyladenosine biosynthesis protein TsaB
MPEMIARLHWPHVVDMPGVAASRAGRLAPGRIGCRPEVDAVSARLLAFDTSTEAMAVALSCDPAPLHWNGAGGAQASAELLPCIRRLLQQAGLGLHQLDAIAFGAGPGAFTGLRTACAVAQGLALGIARPLLPIDSLMLVAEGVRAEHPAAPTDIDVVMDARMGEVYAARYRWTQNRWQVCAAPALHSLQSLHAAWREEPAYCVAGSALAVFGERLCSGEALRAGGEIDRAAALLRLARQRWRDGGGIDAAAALPLYLRDKVALTVAERNALRGAEAGA